MAGLGCWTLDCEGFRGRVHAEPSQRLKPTVLDPETAPHQAGGTPLYMSPEQWTREDTTGATDVWALGIIVYELLAGRRPYAECEGTRAHLGQKVVSSNPVPPLHQVDVPGLADLVILCLAKHPAVRPLAADLAKKFEGMLREPESRGAAAPFPGLLSFTESDAEVFFGRHQEIAQAFDQLRDKSALAIVGPSGSGKTSFVHAGLIPRLRSRQTWTVIALRPGNRPFYTLAAQLLRAEKPHESKPSPRAKKDHDARRQDSKTDPIRRSEEDDGVLQTFRDEIFALSRELIEDPTCLSLQLDRIQKKKGRSHTPVYRSAGGTPHAGRRRSQKIHGVLG